MLSLNRLGAAGLLGFLMACARMGEPPGGPPDAAPPELVSTYPDTMAVLPNFKDNAELRFNEIVSEGSSPNFGLGSGDLEKLIILSPYEGIPNIGWKKSRIVIKPRRGWKPNQVYRIELLPGISDLRNNRSKTERTITFTTGAPKPTRFLEGRVVDWSTGRPEAAGLVEATLLPDSLRYLTLADSAGNFRFGPLPEGVYLVSGVLDANHNVKHETRESFDSATVAADRDSVGELWAFKHDTVAARIQSVAANDSLSIAVQFNQQLNPYQRIAIDSAQVRHLPDSTSLGVLAVLTKEQYDSAYAPKPKNAADSAKADSVAARARVDSIARADSVARADSLRRVRQAQLAPGARRTDRDQPPGRTELNAQLKTRPTLYDKLIIRVNTYLNPGDKYVVQLFGIESVSKVAGKMTLGFEIPKRPKVDSSKVKADSAAADSARRDSTAARPPAARPANNRPNPTPPAPPPPTPAPPPPPPSPTPRRVAVPGSAPHSLRAE